LDSFSTKESVDLAFDEIGIKIASNACGYYPPGIDGETPEGVDDGISAFGAKTIDPRVAGREINEGEGKFMTTRASALAIPNVHAYGV
jgi:hypothetical protein